MNISSHKEYDPSYIAESYAKQIWDDKNLTAIDELIDKNCVIHSLLGDFYGQDYMKNVVQIWLKAFPDLTVKNIATIGNSDLIAIQWKANGTHLGEFKEIQPTGKAVAYAGVTIYRIFQNKIVEYWAYLDMQHLLKQIN